MKQVLFAAALFAMVLLSACTTPPSAPTARATDDVADEAAIRDLVERFGRRLQNVSLLSPNAAQEMQEQYFGLVSASLLETWTKDSMNAPGRLVSSPWPDRIEITTLAKEDPGMYVLTGFVVEISSTEVVGGGASDRIPVRIVVQKHQGHWLITQFVEEN